VILRRFETLRSKQRRTDPPFGGELGEVNSLAGIEKENQDAHTDKCILIN
jgi:hypothetical protein